MGADVSSERGYTTRQAAVFEQKYREMYGEDLSREELLERYRMEKLKADQSRRAEQSRSAGHGDHRGRSQDDRPRGEGGYYSRSKRRSRSRDRDERYDSRRRQEDNFQIIKTTYERSRRSDHREAHEDRDENRPHRSRRHRDNRHENERKSRRSLSRRSSPETSRKENRRKRDTSREMRSSDRKRSPNSDKREKRSSARRSKSTPEDRHKSSRSRRKEPHHSPASNRRSSRRDRDESSSSEDERRKRESKKETTKEQKKQKSSPKENTATKIRDKKKKKSAKAQHHKSAPDLTETNRQYGKGPWERTQSYFDDYSNRPQSWVQELAYGRNATMPGPIMERQIIYSVPGATAKMVDGLGYPLKERSSKFQPVPFETYLMQKPSRQLSSGMSYQQPEVFSSPVSPVRSPNTRIKVPAGAVPAVGPRASGSTSLPIVSEEIVPGREFEVQAHVHPTSGPSTLPSRRPTHRTPPQYASSTLPRSDAPTPKPRTKSPTKEQKFFSSEARKKSTSPKRVSVEKQHTSMITATSAREDFESLLSLEYDMSNMKPIGGEFSTEFPSTFPGNYRPNQEIVVDDVIFRHQPEVKDDAGSMTDSDVITDDEHVPTLGGELSSNSVGYSSGYDLDIPEGFSFDSEGTAMSSVRKNKPELTKEMRGPSQSQLEPRVARRVTKNRQATSQDQLTAPKHFKTKALDLTTIRPYMGKTSSHDKHASPKRKTLDRKELKKGQSHEKEPKTRKSTRDLSTSPARERDIYPANVSLQKSAAQKDGKALKIRKIQHSPKDENYERIMISTRKWKPTPESRKTHDIGVGTKTKHEKSTGIQTAKPRQPTAQPIYFLKPISAQEVFIEDSLASKSETDFSQTQEYSEPSSESNPTRSAASWSRSSTVSSGPQHTEASEMESVVQNFERNSKFYASNKKDHESSSSASTSSATNLESQKPVSLGPSSLVLGVSESIQASSYTGKGGKVFCLTRSRAGSPPPTSRTHTEDDGNMDDHVQLNFQENGQIEQGIERPFMHYEMTEQLEQQPGPQAPPNNEHSQFNAHEVGRWVLDCYTQDQKLTTKRSISQDLPRLAKGSSDAVVPGTHVQLTKQQAVEFEGSFEVESEEDASAKPSEIPKVVPLTREALPKNEEYSGFHQDGRQDEGSGTDISAHVTSELDVPKFVPLTREALSKQEYPGFHRDGSQEEGSGTDSSDHVTSELGIPKVVPLTREALSKHEEYPGFHRDGSQEEGTGTDLSADVTSELGVFQKELIKARQKIQKTREKTPEPEWKTEQYKAQLKQWNASPSSNVVLAEVCSVNDEDIDPPPKVASKEIHPHTQARFLAPDKHTKSEDTDDTTSQSTLSSKSSYGRTLPPENGTQSLSALHQSHPNHENYSQMKPTMLQKSSTQLGGLNKNFVWNHSTVAQPDPGDGWRIVGASKHPHRVKYFNDNLQQGPVVPRAGILRKSVDSALNVKRKNPSPKKEDLPDIQPLKMRSASLNSDTPSCSSMMANPFNKMDQAEINFLVDKFPGRGTVEKTESEMDILEKLEKSRRESRRESLEERTARILGIYRPTASDEEEETGNSSKRKQTEHPHVPPAAVPVRSSNDSKRDMNAYMNNLLTGVADVSPASRKKYFLGEMAIHQHVTSPLAITSTSNKSSIHPAAHQRNEKSQLKETKQPDISESSDDTSSDEATITGPLSVNVSGSVLDASIDCKVKRGNKKYGPQTQPKEYIIPDATGPTLREETMSPRGGMMLSYGNNIYAETPGFHRQQQSFDSTESDEPELKPPSKVHQKLNRPHRAQDSPVPISATSPPLTEKEIGIVRELVQNHSRTASQDSIDDIPSAPPNKQTEPPNSSLPNEPNRHSPVSTSSSRSWSPSRELAREKIEKSIGFTLHERKSGAKPDTDQPTAFSSDEYDTKILSADGKRDAPQDKNAQQDPLDGDQGSLKNVMESIGLDPNEAWLLAV